MSKHDAERLVKDIGRGRDEADVRAELIQMVEAGRVSNADVESLLGKAGLRSLSGPALSAVDPFREALWGGALLAAWVAYRSPDAVRAAMARTSQEFAEWCKNPNGKTLLRRDPWPDGFVYAAIVDDPAGWADRSPWGGHPELVCERPEDEIIKAHQAGSLHAIGRQSTTADYEEIPATAWIDVEIKFDRAAERLALYRPEHLAIGPRWLDLHWMQADIVRVWERVDASHAPPPAPAKRPRGRPPGPQYDDGALVRRMRQLIQTGACSNKNEAALTLAEEAQGRGDVRSKAKRLTEKYNRLFPD